MEVSNFAKAVMVLPKGSDLGNGAQGNETGQKNIKKVD